MIEPTESAPDKLGTAPADNRGSSMNSLVLFAIFIGVYLLLQLVILPKLGVAT